VIIYPARRALAAVACGALLALTLACDSSNSTATPVAPATVAPTETTAPATDTAVPATDTVVPATDTAVPPSDTVAAPTDTAVPPSDTPLPAPATVTPRPPTRVPPTRTPAPVAPTATTEATAPAATETSAPADETPAPTSEATDTPVSGTPPVVDRTKVPGDMSQVIKVPPGKHQIALTFDAGAGTGYVTEILDALRKHNTHITFFITGQWAEQNPDELRAIVAAGHEVANHSYSHPSFPKLSDDQMITELQKCETIIQGEAGISTKPYWRPPFGDETGHVLKVAEAQGYRSIFWTWDSLDSVGKPKTKDFILKRVTESTIQLDGAIILQHIAAEASAQALPEELDRLYAKGLRVVTISELLQP
jgi:peptidoglycan/xylan/chitin deacetylase (PgdA/CDA1 family)